MATAENKTQKREKKPPKTIDPGLVLSKVNLTEREVQAIYGVGIRKLRRMRMTGDGPRFLKISGEIGKPGGRVLYPAVDLRSWMESRPCGGGRAA